MRRRGLRRGRRRIDMSPGEKILVVDDEAEIRNLIREILEDEGFEVATAENGAGARRCWNSSGPGWCCWISGCRTWTALPC